MLEISMTDDALSQASPGTALVVYRPKAWWHSVVSWQGVTRTWKSLARCARLMVGQPDYDAYVQHMRRVHPERPIMSYAEFFRDRQEARYGGKGGAGRCC
jgi:uncharacterized short protein YbdD (DUF466 family)